MLSHKCISSGKIGHFAKNVKLGTKSNCYQKMAHVCLGEALSPAKYLGGKCQMILFQCAAIVEK